MFFLFDIGGTKMRFAASADGQSFGEPKTVLTELAFEKAMEIIKTTALELTKGQKITAAGGGVRALNKDKTALLNQPNFPLWPLKPLKTTLEQVLQAPVFLENDAAIVGLGEALHGVGMGHKIMAYVTLSTGVGGARIVDGHIDVSTQGFEPGQQIIGIDNDLYPYYNGLGYLENYISGNALEKRFKVKPNQLTNPAVWDDVAKYLAIGLNNITVLWSPSIIVLGGGMIGLVPMDCIQFHLKQALKIFPEPPMLVKSKLGDNAGLYGALEFLKQKMGS